MHTIFLATVRSTDCDVIGGAGRCKSCSQLRPALRTAVCRQKKVSTENFNQRTSTSSHATYHSLTSEEKDKRLRNIHHSLIETRKKNTKLESRISRLINDQAISLEDNDAADIISLISDVHPVVQDSFPPDSPQRIFWDQQLLYNRVADTRQMRWDPLIIRFALNLKYLSTSAYRALRKSGIIHLPSERTLSDYTHWSSSQTSINLDYIEEFIRMMQDVTTSHFQCALSMDEMKIKSGLVFDKHNGSLVGFVDLGEVNHSIETLMNGEDEKGTQLADAYVFMARAVFKPSLSMPVAHYFSLNLKGMI